MTKKYPKTSGKKRISSRRWKIDPTTGAKFKTVLPTPDKNVKLDFAEEYVEEISSDPIKLINFKSHLKKILTQLAGEKTKSLIKYALEWLPKSNDYPKHAFGFFLNRNRIETGAEELLMKYNLLHCSVNNFIIISTITTDFYFYVNVIYFF